MLITDDGTEITLAAEFNKDNQIILQVSPAGLSTEFFCSDEEDTGLIS